MFPLIAWIFYLLLLAGGLAVALLIGGREEKIGAVILTLGSLFTPIAENSWQKLWSYPQIGIFVVDVLTMLGFVALALWSRRYWPLWAGAMMIVDVMVHGARMAQAGAVPVMIYAALAQVWGYLIWFVIIAASIMHHRRGRHRGEPPHDLASRTAIP